MRPLDNEKINPTRNALGALLGESLRTPTAQEVDELK
jgi:hypothetical protein